MSLTFARLAEERGWTDTLIVLAHGIASTACVDVAESLDDTSREWFTVTAWRASTSETADRVGADRRKSTLAIRTEHL